MTGLDFHDEQSKFSSRQIKIFMMNGQDFHHDWSRFSSCLVQIFIMKGPELLNVLAKIPKCKRSTLPSSFYGELPGY